MGSGAAVTAIYEITPVGATLAVAGTTALGQHGDAVEHRTADDGRADHQVAGHNLHVTDNATSEPGHEPVG